MRDVMNNLGPKHSLIPAVKTASANGSGVDLQADGGCDGAGIVCYSGAWTDGTFTFEVQHSDDDGSTDAYAAVPDAELVGTEPAISSANQVKKLSYVGGKRWVRVVQTAAGTTSGALIGAMVIRDHFALRPVA